jgi:hypothetical protein
MLMHRYKLCIHYATLTGICVCNTHKKELNIMKESITIKEASLLTGKHPDTIRRLAKDNKQSKHVSTDRKGRITINKAWLLSCFETSGAPVSDETGQADNEPMANNISGIEPVINALTKQLESKDLQIANLQALLSEKESNTTKLQDQFQHLLARQQLTAGSNEAENNTYDKPMQTEVSIDNNDVQEPVIIKQAKPKKVTKKGSKKKPVSKTIKQTSTKKKRWWNK